MGVMQNFGSNILGSFLAPLLLVRHRPALELAHVVLPRRHPGTRDGALMARYVREPQHQPAADAAAGDRRTDISHLAMLRHRNMILCVLMSIVMVAWMVLGWAFLPLFYTKLRHISAGSKWACS